MNDRLWMVLPALLLAFGLYRYGASIARQPTFWFRGVTFRGPAVQRFARGWKAAGILIALLTVAGAIALLTA